MKEMVDLRFDATVTTNLPSHVSSSRDHDVEFISHG